MIKKIMFSNDIKSVELSMDEDSLLSDVRSQLITAKYFADADEADDYRFVLPEIKIKDAKKSVSYNDRIVGEGSEDRFKLREMFLTNGDNEVVLCRISIPPGERPSLIGFRTAFWWSRNKKFQVTCRLKPNRNGADVPEPFLLYDVINTNPNVASLPHPAVVVCVKGSVIEFPIAADCTVGIKYHVRCEQEQIFDFAAAIWSHQSYGKAYGTFDCFNNGKYADEGSEKAHEIVASELTEPNSDGEFVARTYSINVHDVTKWSEYKNYKRVATYSAENCPRAGTTLKSPPAPLQKPEQTVQTVKRKGLDARARVVLTANSANATGAQGASAASVVIDSKSYFPGILIPGQAVPRGPYNGNAFNIDEWEKDPLDASVNVTVLVFKDMETAKRYVGRYNSIT